MPDLIGHLNIGQHQRRYLRVCVLSMRSTVMMDRMGGWAVLSMKTGISVDARTKLRLLSMKIDVLVDRPRLK